MEEKEKMSEERKLDDVISEILKMELEMNKFQSENPNHRPNIDDQWQPYREKLKFLRQKFGIS